MLAHNLRDGRPRLRFLEDRQDLFLRVLSPGHRSLTGLMITCGPVFGEHRTTAIRQADAIQAVSASAGKFLREKLQTFRAARLCTLTGPISDAVVGLPVARRWPGCRSTIVTAEGTRWRGHLPRHLR